MKKVIIVTGANGFLGNNIIRLLQNHPDTEIRALVLGKATPPSLQGLNCQIFYGDVTKPNTLSEIFIVPKTSKIYVIHCAAIIDIKSRPNPLIHKINVGGTKNIIDKCLECNAKLIFISSVHSIPERPNDQTITEISKFTPSEVHGEYAKSKAIASNLILKAIKQHCLSACIIQPSGLIGPYDFNSGYLTEFIKQVKDRKILAVVKGGYNFADVRDVASAIITACFKDDISQSYILANQTVPIIELARIVSQVCHTKPVKTILPLWLAKAVAPLSELYYALRKQPPIFTKYSLSTLQESSNFSHDRATKELNFHPRPIEETIKDTVAWLNSQNPQK